MTQVRNLQSLLNSLAENTEGETVTVRELMNAVGQRAYGPILLLLGFVSISPLTIIPGANWAVALVILLISGQILIGRAYPWVPDKALDFEMKREHLEEGIRTGGKYAIHIDRFLKPRLTILTAAPFAQLVALICVGAALVSFPLGFVPLGPVLPGFAVLLFGLGLTARDGLVILLAGLSLVAATFVLVRVWNRISNVAEAFLG